MRKLGEESGMEGAREIWGRSSGDGEGERCGDEVASMQGLRMRRRAAAATEQGRWRLNGIGGSAWLVAAAAATAAEMTVSRDQGKGR